MCKFVLELVIFLVFPDALHVSQAKNSVFSELIVWRDLFSELFVRRSLCCFVTDLPLDLFFSTDLWV